MTQQPHTPSIADDDSSGSPPIEESSIGESAAPAQSRSSKPGKPYSPGDRRAPRQVSILLAFAGALAIGAVVAAMGHLQFKSVAVYRVAEDVSTEQVAALQDRLARFLTSDSARGETQAIATDAAANGFDANALSFSVFSLTPDQSVQSAQKLADRFREIVEAEARAARTQPTEAEKFAAQHLDELKRGAADAGERLGQLSETLNTAQAGASQNNQLSRWRELSTKYRESRARLIDAQARLATLDSAGPPTAANIDPADRESAERADLGLQQDLKELAVNVAVLTAQIREVHTRSTASLDAAIDAAQALRYESARIGHDHSEPDVSAAMTSITEHADDYRNVVDKFSEAWDKALATLPESAADPSDGAVLLRYENALAAARELEFASSAVLQVIEAETTRLGGDGRAAPQRYELLSTLVRAVQTLQAAHRRLLIESGRIEDSQNFRIDSALRSARGLRGRSRARLLAIEEKLSTAALADARIKYAAAVDDARKVVEQQRTETDCVTQALVEAQEELVDVMARTQDRTAAAQAELLALQVEMEQNRAERIEQQIDRLTEKRLAVAHENPLEPATVSCDRFPVDTGRRLKSGGIAAAATFTVMLLGQFWLARRDPG